MGPAYRESPERIAPGEPGGEVAEGAGSATATTAARAPECRRGHDRIRAAQSHGALIGSPSICRCHCVSMAFQDQA